MQFRQLIISGFIAGAAIFLPGYAFAEESQDSIKPELKKAAVPGILPVKAGDPPIPDKELNDPPVSSQEYRPAVSNPVDKGQTADTPAYIKEMPEQAKQAVKPLPSNAKANPLLNKNAARASVPKVVTGERRGTGIKGSQGEKIIKKAADPIQKNSSKTTKKLNNGPERLKDNKTFHGKSEQRQVSKNSSASRMGLKKPQDTFKKNPVKQNESSPSHSKNYPMGDNLPNPTSRTKASGGSSSDRTSNGNISNSFNDKWFVWVHDYDLIEKHPFTARITFYRSQWVNAPPSPPPLKAPAFLPYTDAISHG